MNWTLVALILCSVAALGWTKIQQCCSPPQWSASIQVHHTAGGIRKPLEENIVNYDYTNKRYSDLLTRFNESLPHPNQYLTLIRFDDNVGMFYYLDLSTGKCVKKQFPQQDFPKHCTPESNVTLFDRYLGVRGGYRVQQWDYTYPKFVQTLLVQPLDEFYTGAECFPVLCVRDGRNGFLTTAIYRDFMTGIRDESTFDIPKECLDAQTVNQLPFDSYEVMGILRP